MPYPVAKLLKKNFGEDLKLTSDASQMLNEMLNKLERKLAKSGNKNYLDAASNLLGPDLGGHFDSQAKNDASYAGSYKTSSQATKDLKLTFPVHRARGGDLGKAIYMASLLETVAKALLNEARGYDVNNKVGKAQVILAISFDKKSTNDATVTNMSWLAQLAYKLGYVAPRPSDKQLQNPKYTAYGMQSILASKGFQAVKAKVNKDGKVEGDAGMSYDNCMTVLLFRKRGTGCSKSYQTRNLLTGRCEGKKPCKDYQSRNNDGRCVGRNPNPPKRKSRKSRKNKKCTYGRKKSGGCKRKPGPKRSRR